MTIIPQNERIITGMDNRPIGFFDSGLGGLTCVPPLMKKLPDERIIYFGDTARTPYGSKATTTIKRFSTEIADFLVESGAKMIVIACNTVSATCVDDLRERFPHIPILGIIEPAARTIAERCTEKNRIGIIGTKVTIASKAYESCIRRYSGGLNIFETSCPAFVPLIEEGIIDNDIMDLTIKYYMNDFVHNNRLDTLVLGCTHYPLISKNIDRIYPELHIINPSDIMADTIAQILGERGMLAKDPEAGNVFYASDLSENFMNMIDSIFRGEGDDAKVKFLNFDMEMEKNAYEF